jgi:CheY-like chemotaxis protein
LVDDEPLLLEIFGAWLGRKGPGRLRTALNGEAALAALAVERFDILITDVRMPIMDGIMLVRSLAKAGLSMPVIIFVSGFSDIDVKEMYSLGAEAFLAKPLRREEFIGVLERSVAERSTLWFDALPVTPRQSLTLHVARIDEGPEGLFCLGRGGFSVHAPKPLSLGKMSFQISFEANDHKLIGEGFVRWYSRANQTAGVEFSYLDPSCRSWIVDLIVDSKPRSFIPDCC